jgi:hypothetical protein
MSFYHSKIKNVLYRPPLTCLLQNNSAENWLVPTLHGVVGVIDRLVRRSQLLILLLVTPTEVSCQVAILCIFLCKKHLHSSRYSRL